jgi:hypothetical protein
MEREMIARFIYAGEARGEHFSLFLLGKEGEMIFCFGLAREGGSLQVFVIEWLLLLFDSQQCSAQTAMFPVIFAGSI